MKETNRELFRKLARLDALMRRGIGRAAHGAHSPHRGQGRVLSILKLQPEMTQRELGYLLDMRKQSLGELLAKLEARGLIARTQSEEDRRAMVIRLTGEGKKAAEALDTENEDESDLFAALNEEEQKQLGEYLDRLIAALEEQMGDGKDERGAWFGGEERFAESFGPGYAGGPHGVGGMHGCGGRGHHGPHGGGPGPRGCREGRGRHAKGGHGHMGGFGPHGGFPEGPGPDFAPGFGPGGEEAGGEDTGE